MNKPNNKPNRRTRRELMGKSVAKVGGWMEPGKVEPVRANVTNKVANIAHYTKLNPPKRVTTSPVKPNPHVDTSMTPTEPLSAGLSRTLSRPGPAVRYPYGPK